MKVLYIGGKGEISYSCIQRSLALGYEVAVFNRGSAGSDPVPDGARHIIGDIDDPAAITALADEHFDAVCQFIVFTTEQLQRDIDAFAGHCGQYVFISSASCYQAPEEGVISELTPLVNPFWGYSQAKIACEHLLNRQAEEGKMTITIVRPSHTYRCRFPGGCASGDDWAWRMLNGRPIVVHGDGTTLWTWTHAGDFAKPFANLLGNENAYNEHFHITRHMEAWTWNRIFAAMADALGVTAEIVHVPTDTLVRYNPEWIGPFYGDKAMCKIFDNSKVMAAAGEFTCDVGLQDGMAMVAENFLKKDAANLKPDPDTHALLDKIAEDQLNVGF